MTEVWKIQEDQFPETESIDTQIKFCLKYAILAPSVHNSQPWRFKIVNSCIEIYVIRTESNETIDPENRERIISTGILVYFLEATLNHFGFNTAIELVPDLQNRPDLIALVEFEKDEDFHIEDRTTNHFRAIVERRTNRGRYLTDQIPNIVFNQLLNCLRTMEDEDIGFYFIRDSTPKNQVISIITDADKALMKNKLFRREIASWLHSNKTHKKDGIPAFAFEKQKDIISKFNAFIIKHFNVGKYWASRDKKILASCSPLIMIVTNKEDSELSWAKVGYYLGKMLLEITFNNLAYSFVNQPCLIPEYRSKLSSLVDMNVPQAVLRIGFCGKQIAKPTQRKNLQDFLI